MRQDAYKVIHETSRAGAVRPVVRALHLVEGECLDDTRQSMRKRYWPVGLKSMRIDTTVLRRFLLSRVGRPWSEVYSELRQSLRQRDCVLDDPLRYMAVETNTDLIDGEVCYYGKTGGVHPVSECGGFYVHPVTGLLQNAVARRSGKSQAARQAHQALLAARMRVVSEQVQLHKVDGLWFEVTLAPLPSAQEYREALSCTGMAYVKAIESVRKFDVLLGKTLWPTDTHAVRSTYGRPGVYAKSKRQLSRRELKAYGLQQDEAA